MIRLCFLVFLLFACSLWSVDPALTALVETQAKLQQVQGTFTRTIRPAGSLPDEVSHPWSGTFAFARPNRSWVRIAEVGQESWDDYRTDGVQSWKSSALDAATEPTIERSPYPDPGWERARKLILLDKDALELDYTLSLAVVGEKERLHPKVVKELLLTPKTDKIKKDVIAIKVQFDATDTICAVWIHDAQDNRETYTVQSADWTSPIPLERFRWPK